MTDQISIAGWRLVIHATRQLNQLKRLTAPVCAPLYPYLWIPAMALLAGVFIGWAIALA